VALPRPDRPPLATGPGTTPRHCPPDRSDRTARSRRIDPNRRRPANIGPPIGTSEAKFARSASGAASPKGNHPAPPLPPSPILPRRAIDNFHRCGHQARRSKPVPRTTTRRSPDDSALRAAPPNAPARSSFLDFLGPALRVPVLAFFVASAFDEPLVLLHGHRVLPRRSPAVPGTSSIFVAPEPRVAATASASATSMRLVAGTSAAPSGSKRAIERERLWAKSW